MCQLHLSTTGGKNLQRERSTVKVRSDTTALHVSLKWRTYRWKYFSGRSISPPRWTAFTAPGKASREQSSCVRGICSSAVTLLKELRVFLKHWVLEQIERYLPVFLWVQYSTTPSLPPRNHGCTQDLELINTKLLPVELTYWHPIKSAHISRTFPTPL